MKLTSIEQLNRAPHALDSHAGMTSASRLAPDFRQTVTLEGQTDPSISTHVYYPRIKCLGGGRYLMLHMDNRLGGNVFYAFSDDFIHYTPRKKLFAAHPVVRDDGAEDKIMYANGEAVVAKNGDLLVFASYRYNGGYALDAKYGGIVMRRSTDGGETFSDEVEIYRGRNWESFPLIKRDGEIQLFFSHTAPKFYLDKTVRTDSPIKTSSGTAMIRSTDNGCTWTPNVTAPPYAAHRVTQSYVATMDNGTKCFTNQMATAAELGDGSIVISTESDLANYTFRLTLSYTHDNFAHALDIDEDGPADKNFAFADGAGPYIAHFPSGETALSYNRKGLQHIAMGDENGKNFDLERQITTFGGRWGYWGALTVEDGHTLISAYPHIFEDKSVKPYHIDNDLMLGKLRLNHAITAAPYTEDFAGNTEALFVGGASQAQIAVRAAFDAEKLYLRVDRLDALLTAGDGVEFWLRAGGHIYRVGSYLAGRRYILCDGAKCEVELCGTDELFGQMHVRGDNDNGAVTLLSLPRALLGGENRFELRVALKNNDGLDTVTDGEDFYFPIWIGK